MRRPDRFRVAFALAVGLHGAVLLLGERSCSEHTHTTLPAAARPAELPALLELDTTELQGDAAWSPGAARAASSVEETKAQDGGAEKSTGPAGRGTPPLEESIAIDLGALPGEEQGALADAALHNTPPAAPSAGTAPGRALSLSALGLTGSVRDASVARLAVPRDETHSAEARLENSMASAVLDRDQGLGLHSAGPILRALRTRVAQSVTAVNSRAVFNATVGADGKLVDLEVLESTSARAAWLEVAEAVRALLARQAFRVPGGGHGLSFVIEVVSREQLPSGADPGLGISVAGVPLKEGKGKKSARVEILGPPRLVEQTVKVGETQIKVPMPVIPIASLVGDPADIGASAQRVVQVRLLRQRPL